MKRDYAIRFGFDDRLPQDRGGGRGDYSSVIIEFHDGSDRELSVWTQKGYDEAWNDPQGGSDENLRKFFCYPDVIVSSMSRGEIREAVATYLQVEYDRDPDEFRRKNQRPAIVETFLNLPTDQRRAVHLDLCNRALCLWENYCDRQTILDYVETVSGTKQEVDRGLPTAAIQAVIGGSDSGNVALRYREPIAAFQDNDLELPCDVELAYFSIYNLFRHYVSNQFEDDWLIVDQALSAHGIVGVDYASILASAMDQTGEQDADDQAAAAVKQKF